MTEVSAGEFRAIGTANRILVTDADALDAAMGIARVHLAQLDAAASRFRADSEVSRLAARAAASAASWYATPLLVDYLHAARRVAWLTDGLVDVTVGAALAAQGYDRDIEQVRARPWAGGSDPGPAPGWRAVEIDEATGRVHTPAGAVLDLGASAKAHAADRVAGQLAARLPGGFLVDLGGDLAVSGPPPAGGWQVGVQRWDGSIAEVIAVRGAAIATSSTRLRAWGSGPAAAHHIVDPRTGAVAAATWSQVTCTAETALAANAASTAALVLGPQAPGWLSQRGISARLEHRDGYVIRTGNWPVAPPGGVPMATAS